MTQPTDWLIRYEQLRMPLQAMQWAIYPGMVLLAVLFMALEQPCDEVLFRSWCAVAALTWLGGTLHARYWLGRQLDPPAADRLLLQLKLLYAFEGAVWGFLPWLTLNSCSPIENAMVFATNAGVAASRMMLLSSVPGVFLTYILVGAAVWVGKTLTFPDLPLHALGLIGALYVITLIFQARVHSRMLENAIRLRFENRSLLDQLSEQMRLAETARREAETANTAKSRFLAAASHDLRQPAHAQGLYLDLLARTALDDRQRELLDNVRSLSGASAELLDTLLDYSRIEAGAIEPRRRNFSLQTMLNQIEREFGPQADAKGLVYRTRDTRLVAYSDPKLVERILRNLVSNAIRYTRQGGVLVTCRRRAGGIELAVWDTGIGIAEEQQAAVFQEFLQLGNPERDRRKGCGLGLAIVAGLARSLEHRLTLVSHPGQGSVFRLALPAASAAPPLMETLDDSAVPVRAAHVLVVDDDPAVLDGMRRLLESWGYRCSVASGIGEALEIARRAPPEAVITDYRLRGDQTGNDLVADLLALTGRTLPALLVTGDTSPERIQEARAGGMPVLHKPVAPEVLKRELIAMLDRHEDAASLPA